MRFVSVLAASGLACLAGLTPVAIAGVPGSSPAQTLSCSPSSTNCIVDCGQGGIGAVAIVYIWNLNSGQSLIELKSNPANQAASVSYYIVGANGSCKFSGPWSPLL